MKDGWYKFGYMDVCTWQDFVYTVLGGLDYPKGSTPNAMDIL